MIRGFRGKVAESLWERGVAKGFPASLQRRALDKLQMLNAAHAVEDLRNPPGNRLEALRGDRAGTWSIRINDQFRLVFRFVGSDAFDVEIVDYH